MRDLRVTRRIAPDRSEVVTLVLDGDARPEQLEQWLDLCSREGGALRRGKRYPALAVEDTNHQEAASYHRPAPSLVYLLLEEKAREIGWPEYYRDDLLVHDRTQLSRPDAPGQFVWVLRRHGTNLHSPLDTGAQEWVEAVRTVYGYEQPHWFIYAGGALREVEADEAVDWVTTFHDTETHTFRWDKVRKAYRVFERRTGCQRGWTADLQEVRRIGAYMTDEGGA